MIPTPVKRLIAFLLVPGLVLLFARAVTAYHGDSASEARRIMTQETARRLILLLDVFRAAHHRLPTAEEGLVLLSPNYIETIPADAWGRPFAYAPSVDNMWADVVSYGADGRPGGKGDDADVSGRFGSLALHVPIFVEFLAHFMFLAVLATGLLAAQQSPWAAGTLSGMAALCALVLVAVITTPLDLSFMGVVAPFVALACLTGSLAVLRRTTAGPVVASGAVLSAYVVLGKLIAV